MTTPVKKHTRSRSGKRRSHDALKKVKLTKCPKCHQPTRPHQACPSCGTYKGRVVIEFKDKKAKSKSKEKK